MAPAAAFPMEHGRLQTTGGSNGSYGNASVRCFLSLLNSSAVLSDIGVKNKNLPGIFPRKHARLLKNGMARTVFFENMLARFFLFL